MKKNSFIGEFVKSGAFIVLIVFTILIILGIIMTNHRHSSVRLKENMMYVVPRHS